MDDRELIRLRAYEIWIQEGQPEGRELEHWMQARRDVLGTPQTPEESGPPEGSEMKNVFEQD